MPTKLELAKQLEAAMGTASIDGAAFYVGKPKAWLENQLRLNGAYARATAGFNQALGVKLATNAQGHAAAHTCSVCTRWIGHTGQLWAFRPNQAKIGEHKPQHVVSPTHWHLIDAYCLECASS